ELADDVLVKELFDLPRRGDIPQHGRDPAHALALLAEDVLTQIDAVGADVDLVGSLHHRPDLAACLAAERAGGDSPAAEAGVAPAGSFSARSIARVLGHRLPLRP